MDPIKTIEHSWGWEIDLPCIKCGERACLGSYSTVISRLEDPDSLQISPASNVKEAIDNCQEMHRMWSIYCGKRSRYDP